MSLQREVVARAALRLLDEVGLDGLTMRRLAAYLNIQNPSLYWHFTNKQELLNCMAEVMVADSFADLHPPIANEDWATWLAGYAHLLRRMALARRDGTRVLAQADLTIGPFMAGLDLAAQVLREEGFSPRSARVSVTTLLYYVLGAAFEIQADPSHNSLLGNNDLSTPPALPHCEPGPPPTLANRPNETDRSRSAREETWFEDGLRLLLDGMRVTLARESEHREHPRRN